VKLLIQTAAEPGSNVGLNEKHLWVIQEEIARMENIIQGLLDFARPPLLDRVRHDLRDTVQRAVNLVEGRAKQQKVAIRTQLPEAAVMVDGDPAQIHQVFVNLLLNGMDAAGRGGALQVIVREPDTPGGCCRISFLDSGKGVPDESLHQLFEPFVTTKEQGIGLGLAISRRIVEEHGGAIHVANCDAGGAEFTVLLSTSSASPERPTPLERTKAEAS
jgi:signal transduction histidine kinase